MVLFIAIGAVSLIVGVMFLFAPDALRKANDETSKLITNVEDWIFDKKIGVGLSMIIASLLFFFVAYYIDLKG